jgi:NAD(P)-dependent dehydrogenase (short-subunit alcohol dehydrogenase family)
LVAGEFFNFDGNSIHCMGRFDGKVVLVTGGSRSIGRACAIEFAKEGADLAVNYADNVQAAEEAIKAIRAVGRECRAYRADVANSSQVNSMVETIINDFGKIDVLLNNAGILRRTPFLKISEIEWDSIVDTNLKGFFLVGQAVARHMVERQSGAIVNMSSAGQELALNNLSHYCAAKAGVSGLTRSMALELAPYGIRVNAVAPGNIETDMNRKDFADADFRERRLARIPLKIIGKPEDITKAVLFLASDDARLSTGRTIYLDAGANIYT